MVSWRTGVALTFLGCAAAADPLRIIKGQVTEAMGDSITIADASRVANHCFRTPESETLGLNGVAAPTTIEVGQYAEAIVAETSDRCVIRTLYLRAPRPAPMLSPPSRPAMLDNLFPRGNLILTGTVQDLTAATLELHTRKGGRTTFQVRPDTTFSTGGRVVTPKELGLQTVVQVRAGRTLFGELEVYQVTWGGILPRTVP